MVEVLMESFCLLSFVQMKPWIAVVTMSLTNGGCRVEVLFNQHASTRAGIWKQSPVEFKLGEEVKVHVILRRGDDEEERSITMHYGVQSGGQGISLNFNMIQPDTINIFKGDVNAQQMFFSNEDQRDVKKTLGLPGNHRRALFRIPEQISNKRANQAKINARQWARGLTSRALSDIFPDVVLSYATGGRRGSGDAFGTGPGELWTAAFQHVLSENQILSYSGLLLPTGENWQPAFFRRIAHRSCSFPPLVRCTLFIPILTKAFFESPQCLSETFYAAKYRITIFPIRVEENLPRKLNDEVWPTGPAHYMCAPLSLARKIAFDALTKTNHLPHHGTMESDIDDDEALDANILEFVQEVMDHVVRSATQSDDTCCWPPR